MSLSSIKMHKGVHGMCKRWCLLSRTFSTAFFLLVLTSAYVSATLIL